MRVKLKDLINIQNGKEYSKLNEGSIPLYGSGGIFKYVDSYLYDGEAILLPRKGTLDNIIYLNNTKFWTVDTMYYAIPDNKKVNGKFLYYYLTLFNFSKFDIGSTIPSMTTKLYYDIEIDLPARIIQDKIVNILSNIDNQIKRNDTIIERLQDMIHTIYSVTFEQYLGKEKEMNSILKREIPINWEARELKDFIHLVNGISYSEKDLISGIPMINLNSFNLDGSYKTSGIKKYNGKYKEENTLKPYDLLISKTDVTRNRDIICKSVLVPDYYDTDIVYTSDISKVECINISKYYLNSLFNSKSFHDYIKQFANGTVVLHLIVDGLLNFKIPIPNDCTFDEFDNRVEPLYKQINLLIKNNMDLSKLKDAILPLLINGQLEV